MEPEGSLPSSQEPSTCTYPEPDQSSPQRYIQPETKIYLFISLVWNLCISFAINVCPEQEIK
jgi:hypothetical protein